ncbi:hypothetical protein [Lentibacillus salicampi]|uniref:Uncharacterized protein n=1 Tax=Lentibacillus salicampi TaxID=175306 RepID=A0A4Y9A888_9BACI|nr:hypothetical protein [Lentibacillus salicampi]TFJ91685.1 hypothetical protein E4U82_16260 [Lentibacillus salicampi]
MPKVKIHPLILVGLFINSVAMVFYAYRSYSNQEMGHGIIFTLLFIFLIGLVIWGIVRNKKIDYTSK